MSQYIIYICLAWSYSTSNVDTVHHFAVRFNSEDDANAFMLKLRMTFATMQQTWQHTLPNERRVYIAHRHSLACLQLHERRSNNACLQSPLTTPRNVQCRFSRYAAQLLWQAQRDCAHNRTNNVYLYEWYAVATCFGITSRFFSLQQIQYKCFSDKENKMKNRSYLLNYC